MKRKIRGTLRETLTAGRERIRMGTVRLRKAVPAGKKLVQRGLRILREMVYPEGAVCLGCGRISRGDCLCPACRKELQEKDFMESWEIRRVEGVQAWSMRPHRGIARQLVLRMKHGAESRAAAELAALVRTRPEAFPQLDPETVVTWVPGPKDRIRERCIDHGKMLAEAVAGELGLKSGQMLQRKGNDRPQARLDLKAWEKNLRKAFEPVRKIRQPVLLVDDVLTTGTTAKRCVRALRKGGAEELLILTATYAVKRG